MDFISTLRAIVPNIYRLRCIDGFGDFTGTPRDVAVGSQLDDADEMMVIHLSG